MTPSAQKAADRKARRKAKARRLNLEAGVPSRATLRAETQKLQSALNAAVRERDGAVCISCGRTGLVVAMGGTWQAGHLFNVKTYPALRFHPLNIHSQCSQCNSTTANRGGRMGNQAAYSAEFIRRRGLETFQALDAIKAEVRQWRILDLIELRTVLTSGGIDAYQARYFDLTGWKVAA